MGKIICLMLLLVISLRIILIERLKIVCFKWFKFELILGYIW